MLFPGLRTRAVRASLCVALMGFVQPTTSHAHQPFEDFPTEQAAPQSPPAPAKQPGKLANGCAGVLTALVVGALAVNVVNAPIVLYRQFKSRAPAPEVVESVPAEDPYKTALRKAAKERNSQLEEDPTTLGPLPEVHFSQNPRAHLIFLPEEHWNCRTCEFLRTEAISHHIQKSAIRLAEGWNEPLGSNLEREGLVTLGGLISAGAASQNAIFQSRTSLVEALSGSFSGRIAERIPKEEWSPKQKEWLKEILAGNSVEDRPRFRAEFQKNPKEYDVFRRKLGLAALQELKELSQTGVLSYAPPKLDEDIARFQNPAEFTDTEGVDFEMRYLMDLREFYMVENILLTMAQNPGSTIMLGYGEYHTPGIYYRLKAALKREGFPDYPVSFHSHALEHDDLGGNRKAISSELQSKK